MSAAGAARAGITGFVGMAVAEDPEAEAVASAGETVLPGEVVLPGETVPPGEVVLPGGALKLQEPSMKPAKSKVTNRVDKCNMTCFRTKLTS